MDSVKPVERVEPVEPANTTAARPAIFLDRDGTLVEDRGDLGHPAEAQFLPGAIDALRALQGRFLLFIVTHQPAIAAGRLTCEQVDAVNASVVDRLGQAGVAIERVFVCPHERSQGCDCIKPRPHFLRIAERLHRIDLLRSYTVGDHAHDAELGRAVGATGVYVLTGHGLSHLGALSAGHIVVPSLADLPAAIAADAGGPLEPGAAARRVVRGGVVAFPTETVYGLGANALDPKAVARIFEIKRRPAFDPLIVHFADRGWVARLAREVPPGALTLMQAFWPGPLTIVLPKTALVPDLVTAGLDTVGLRLPRHPLALAFLEAAGVPIAAPSANLFGHTSPTSAEHVREQLGDQVEHVLDGGPAAVGIESTIVLFVRERPILLRPGGIPVEELEAALGQPVPTAAAGQGVAAPGMLPRHYAPRTELVLFEGSIPAPPAGRAGLLLQRSRPAPDGYAAVEVLSRDGDLGEVAHHLFAALRRLDRLGLDAIVAELAPEVGLGRAIDDRLRRASAR